MTVASVRRVAEGNSLRVSWRRSGHVSMGTGRIESGTTKSLWESIPLLLLPLFVAVSVCCRLENCLVPCLSVCLSVCLSLSWFLTLFGCLCVCVCDRQTQRDLFLCVRERVCVCGVRCVCVFSCQSTLRTVSVTVTILSTSVSFSLTVSLVGYQSPLPMLLCRL